MRFFIGKGYQPHQAAGIVGNLLQESQLNVGAINPGDGNDGSDSVGIAQWNGPRAVAFRQYAQANGLDPNALNTQLGFVDHELNTTETRARDGLMAAEDPIKAAMAFAGFERPQGWTAEEPWNSHGWGNRAQQAAALAGMSYDTPQGSVMQGGAPLQAMPQPAGAPARNLPPADVMQALFASEATRPIAIAMAKANIEGQQLPKYTTFTGEDGALMQMNTQTGEMKVLMTPNQANGPDSETFFGNGVPIQMSDGTIQYGQFGNQGGFNLPELPPGASFLSPVQQLNTGTGFTGVDKFGNPTGTVTPIDNQGANYDQAFGTAAGKAAAERIDALPGILANADNMVATIDGVLNDPALDVSTGWLSWMQAVPNTEQYRFGQRSLQLQGQAFLQAFDSLKGAGQITEIEGSKATQAIGRLSTAQSPEDYRTALEELKSLIQGAKGRAVNRAGTTPPSATPGGTTANGLNWSVN